jgi:hypothetical protein
VVNGFWVLGFCVGMIHRIFIGIMGGRIQFAPTGMDVMMKDPTDIRFFTIGYIVEIYL